MNASGADESRVDLAEHARQVEQLWSDYRNGVNRRVPFAFACDEQLYLKVSGHTFRQFYKDPSVHLHTQLQGQHWFRRHVIGDMNPELPDRWQVGTRLWMEEDEYFGCEVIYQEDDYAWAKPIPLDRESLLSHLRDIDPEERVRTSCLYRLYTSLKELAEKTTYIDRPVDVIPPGRGTHGVFTKAAELRGLDQLCLDLYEAPEFARELLEIVTEKTIGRIRAWRRLTGESDDSLPMTSPWGCPDDSLQMISSAMYTRFVLPCHRRLFAAMTTGPRSIHNCGRASQHYESWVRELNVTTIDGPGPFVDHGHYLRLLSPNLSFNAQTSDGVIAHGTEAEIEAMMRHLMSPTAKIPGRYNIVAFVTRDMPLERVRLSYRLARELGAVASTRVSSSVPSE